MPTDGDSKKHASDDVYDRQIRLWGADAQDKMCSARVLYVNVTGVSSEIIKNLVLAGVAASICDGRPYPDAVESTPTSFFPASNMDVGAGATEKEPDPKKRKLTVASAVRPKIEELNPLLGECPIDERALADVPDDFFGGFDAVVASRVSLGEARRMARATTKAGGAFILADSFGMDGCGYLDLGPDHTYRREMGKDKLSDVLKVDPYVSLNEMLDRPMKDATGRWDKVPPRVLVSYRALMEYRQELGSNASEEDADKFVDFAKKWMEKEELANACLSRGGKNENGIDATLKDLASVATAEISPVCAILGGVLGNEVIKALTGKGEPANNVLLFDGTAGSCRSFLIKK